MPVLFGDVRGDGLIRVWNTLHRVKGKTIEADDYPEGYEFESMPKAPKPEPGVSHIWLFDPETRTHSFESEERPWTQEEIVEYRIPELEKEIADLEQRVAALEGNRENPKD